MVQHKHNIDSESSNSDASSIPSSSEDDEESWKGATWEKETLRKYVTEKRNRCVILIDGYVVDVTSYLGEHVSSFAAFANIIRTNN